MNLVAFTGKRGHGKNSCADVLIAQGWTHLAFADPLRDIAKIAYGVTDHEMADTVLKEQVLARWPSKSPREILQRIGTDMFRAYVPDTWTKTFERRAREALAAGAPGVVCSDLRFLNEADTVTRLGGTIIRVVDPNKLATDAASLHASETELEQIVEDITIQNDGTLADLHARVTQALAA